MASPPKTLRILCFGNSLTAGYSLWGMEHYPYADHLPGPLQKLFPSTNISIDVAALSGDRVIGPQGQYLRRLESRCTKAHVAPYDWMIIMGGTNDLGMGYHPESIYEGLKKAWKLALDTGTKVLALNVIEAAHPAQEFRDKRTALNTLIANHSEDRWYTLDICSKIPYFAMPEEKRQDIWDDGLHLTKEGYKIMGEAVAAKLVEILAAEE